MVDILILIHKMLLIVTAALLGIFFIYFGARALGAVLVNSKECFRLEPYYSSFLVLITLVSTTTLVLEIIKQ